jgi:hypothetical protein
MTDKSAASGVEEQHVNLVETNAAACADNQMYRDDREIYRVHDDLRRHGSSGQTSFGALDPWA